MPDFMLTKKTYKFGERFTVPTNCAASFTINNKGDGSEVTVDVYMVEPQTDVVALSEDKEWHQ